MYFLGQSIYFFDSKIRTFESPTTDFTFFTLKILHDFLFDFKLLYERNLTELHQFFFVAMIGYGIWRQYVCIVPFKAIHKPLSLFLTVTLSKTASSHTFLNYTTLHDRIVLQVA